MKNSSFVPFVTARAAAPAPPAPGAPQLADSAGAFRPLTVGAAAGPEAPHPAREPKVALEREGDRVSRIRIECSCGHTIELACTY